MRCGQRVEYTGSTSVTSTALNVNAAAATITTWRARAVAPASSGSNSDAARASVIVDSGQAQAPRPGYMSNHSGSSSSNMMNQGTRTANSAAAREGVRPPTQLETQGR